MNVKDLRFWRVTLLALFVVVPSVALWQAGWVGL